MEKLGTLLLGLYLCFPSFSYASDFQACMEEEEVIDLDASVNIKTELMIPLPTKHLSRSWVTNAFATLNFFAKGFQIQFSFPLPRGQVSIPYNVYHAQISTIATNGESVAHHVLDFTDECRKPGIAIFPGDKIKTYPVYYRLPDLKKGESLRVQIWGHL